MMRQWRLIAQPSLILINDAAATRARAQCDETDRAGHIQIKVLAAGVFADSDRNRTQA